MWKQKQIELGKIIHICFDYQEILKYEQDFVDILYFILLTTFFVFLYFYLLPYAAFSSI